MYKDIEEEVEEIKKNIVSDIQRFLNKCPGTWEAEVFRTKAMLNLIEAYKELNKGE